MPTPAQLQILKTEIDTDPLTRGYAGMTDLQIADDMNLFNRAGAAPSSAVFAYLASETNQTGQGSDTTATSILGRLQHVAEARPKATQVGNEYDGDDVFDRGTASGHVKVKEKHAAAMLFALVTSGQSVDVDWTANAFDSALDELVGNANAGVMKPGDKTAIVALSQNITTRGRELGLGKVREGHVTQAKALP